MYYFSFNTCLITRHYCSRKVILFEYSSPGKIIKIIFIFCYYQCIIPLHLAITSPSDCTLHTSLPHIYVCDYFVKVCFPDRIAISKQPVIISFAIIFPELSKVSGTE